MADSTGNPTLGASAMRGNGFADAIARAGAQAATHHGGAESAPAVAIAGLRLPRVDEPASHADAFSFGYTRVVRGRRHLSYNGAKVDLGDRAFDLLLALIDARGSILSKDQLMERVWPGRIVEENTLEGQISILRRALGDNRSAIRTVAGRGYQFIGELSEARAATPTFPTASASSRLGVGLPASISRLIGREAALRDVRDLACSHRLVTLVGTGGVGKTRLAIEAARLLAPHFSEGVYLAELAATASPDYLPTTVALALGLPPGEATSSLERLAPHVHDRSILLLLDNCEHLIESAAHFAETFLRVAPLASIVATSREPLRVTGEYLYRVASLEVPSNDSDAEAPGFAAVQLLEERVGSETVDCIDRALALSLKARICRRLDGIPLAVELAAACVPAFGLQGVAERLDDRFQLLTRGARGALPRQQTLRATLDWSYGLLPEIQSTVLNRLSVFPGAFTLELAQIVANCERISPNTVVAALIELVNKSLVSAILGDGHVRYRLLETTRAYAHDRLQASDMLHEISGRHARHFLALFQHSAQQAAACADID
ncbi:MAG TPA: winged helix-turn-helix domain-containing protein [Paraburkholderia sp.]